MDTAELRIRNFMSNCQTLCLDTSFGVGILVAISNTIAMK